MKKYLLALCTALIAGSALADAVSITSQTSLSTPNLPNAVTSTNWVGFNPSPSPTIILPIAGKTCTWVSSTVAGGPQGCNYSITVNVSNNTLSNPQSSGNAACTPANQMLANCR